MHARHIMSSPVTTVSPQTSVAECLRIVEESGFTVLPVVDEKHHVVGIVSEGDLLRATFQSPSAVRAASGAMTSPVVAMQPDTDISALASAMLRSGLRGIPILQDRELVGIVTRRDLIAVLTVDDDRIRNEIQHRLDVYGGTSRWTVQVTDGRVRMGGLDSEDPESGVVTALTETVPGVSTVTLIP
jgi:CBS domain-containing protein